MLRFSRRVSIFWDAVRLRAQGTMTFGARHQLVGNATQTWLYYEQPDRDLVVLQAKLIVDGFRDLLLVPASLVAGDAVGSGADAIDVVLAELAADAGSGGIFVESAGDLDIADVPAFHSAISAAAEAAGDEGAGEGAGGLEGGALADAGQHVL